MVKEDERQLFAMLKKQSSADFHPYVRQVVAELGMDEHRAYSILLKWCHRGWYEYGVAVLAGWLTDEGMKAELPK